MSSPLDLLLEEGIITDVVGRLQSGKEAEVFLVRYGERIVAAKVYKDKSQRSFKNKSAYQEGRAVRNTRDQRAMDRRSRFGKGAEEDAWKSAEADALYRLHAAEVRVPTPVLFFEGVLLMELVVDASGVTARRLIDTTLSVEDANAAYHDMLTQLVRMLACDLIHGDLSPYNVLWGAGGATIIDFPQIVSAAQNSNSERFFLRDAENILGYFRAVDARLNARRSDAAEIWRAYMRRELSADFVPTGKVAPPPAQRPLLLPAQRPVTGHAQRPQTSGGNGPRPQGKHFDPPRAPVGNQRGNGPSQPTRSNGPSQPTRGNGPSQPARGNASQPAGRNFGKARRVPEVIVRPRAAERQAPSEPSGSEKRDPAAASRARRLP
jgi:RIO kinase 1